MARKSSPAAEHIGQLMSAERLAKGLTQDEVAVKSGIDSSNIRAYEKGRAMPNVHSLIRVAAALDVDPGLLLTGLSPKMFEATPAQPRRQA